MPAGWHEVAISLRSNDVNCQVGTALSGAGLLINNYVLVSVADRQTALDDAELITPVGSTNALNVFDQMPEPTSKLGRLAEVKSRLKPAPVIQINERHTVL